MYSQNILHKLLIISDTSHNDYCSLLIGLSTWCYCCCCRLPIVSCFPETLPPHTYSSLLPSLRYCTYNENCQEIWQFVLWVSWMYLASDMYKIIKYKWKSLVSSDYCIASDFVSIISILCNAVGLILWKLNVLAISSYCINCCSLIDFLITNLAKFMSLLVV